MNNSLLSYRDPKIWSIYFLSFSSGLPFLLTLATLQVWLKEEGLSNTLVGTFALVTLPYSLKFLWAPLMDTFHLPFLGKVFGHRKSWILLSQMFLIPSLIFLGVTSPGQTPLLTAFAALLVSFFSATQDIGVEAYRLDLLEKKHVGFGSGVSNLGYRTGMWVSGAGALYLSALFNWSLTYGVMAIFIGFGIVATLLSPEISSGQKHTFERPSIQKHLQVLNHLMAKPTPWFAILGIIIFFKMTDTFLNVMSIPFMLDIGFGKLDIANVSKSFGIAAMILGGVVASFSLARYPLYTILKVTALLQLCSSGLFIIQSLVGTSYPLLFATMGLDNFSCGLGAAAFVTYLSHLSRHEFSATHFALLTSFASLCRVGFSYFSGVCADKLSWPMYFSATGFVAAGYFLTIFLNKHHLNALTHEGEMPEQKAA